ncbi:magnesium transporter [Rothia sp. AR01]|uniref:Magnesium transporter MgtE n=1 Tax=Rothia santali TaxID=2949643 RepID=A0A9X2HCQ8_9MICC|nr:magnesium transporter [Rothia santali]MCP3425865.1 magnesium transporter [Rothia santali]
MEQLDLNATAGIWTELIAEGRLDAVAEQAASLSRPDLVRTLERLPVTDRAVAFRLLAKDEAHAVFERFDDGLRAELFSSLRDDDVVRLFDALDPDDRVHLMDELPAGVTHRLLQRLSEEERELTAPILGYERGVIGRRMSTEYVRLHPGHSVGDALTLARRRGDDAETIYVLPVVDDSLVLVGVVGLRALFLAGSDALVADLMTAPISVSAHDEEEAAARRCVDAQVLAVPVVDREDRLVGILTFDDAVRIIQSAEDEDASRAGASEPLGRPYLSTPITRLVRSRAVWLFFLAISAALTVGVLDYFEDDLAQVVALASFIPLLIGTGGNTGSQAAVTITRALAVGDVRSRDIGRVLLREVRVGAVLGLTLGGIAFLVILGVSLFSASYTAPIGLTVGISMLAICVLAASAGGAIPCIAKSLRIDPAVMSTPFIATFVDATGLIVYFLVAKAILGI